jgi:hypothetical protein
MAQILKVGRSPSMRLARWRHGKAEEEGAEVSGAAVIEANVAADANDGSLLLTDSKPAT